MTWYADLAPCSYFGRRGSMLRAIGWLSASHDYVHGHLDDPERGRLEALLADLWSPFHSLGFHACEFCQGYCCRDNLWIPGPTVVFVAPDAILHYVDRHEYLPPGQFLDAIMACPDMGSEAYFSALVAAGGREFALMTGLVAPDPVLCAYCGRPLRTPKARQCRFCKVDWHDPTNPRKLGCT